MRRVILESPYAGDVAANTDYARRCMRDSLDRGEAPLASHLLYTQPGVLDDSDPAERHQGVAAGHAWTAYVDAVVVYVDHGLSPGMRWGVRAARDAGVPVEYRRLKRCPIRVDADRTTCTTCGLAWDTNDSDPPACCGAPVAFIHYPGQLRLWQLRILESLAGRLRGFRRGGPVTPRERIVCTGRCAPGTRLTRHCRLCLVDRGHD